MYQEFDLPDEPGTPPPDPRTSKRRKNQPHFDLAQSLYRMTGVDLTQVDGLDAMTVQDILSEIGTDVSPWPTVKHFASWLRLSPNNKVTGGKVKQRGTQPTKNRATTAFRVAAQSLARLVHFIAAFVLDMVLLKQSQPQLISLPESFTPCSRDPGADYYEEQYRIRAIRSLQRRASKLGMRLEPAAVT